MNKDLKLRIIIGAVFGPFIFFSAIYWEWVFSVIVFLMLIYSLKEFFYLLNKMDIYHYSIYGYFFGILIFIDFLFFSGRYFFLTFLIFLLSLSPMIFIRRDKSVLKEISWTFFGTLYLSVFITAILLILVHVDNVGLQPLAGGKIASLIFVSVWFLDITAFFTGRRFGRHSFFSSISPQKTLEGAVGGFLGAVISSIIAKHVYISFLSVWGALGIGIIVGIFGQIGDLIESAIKRKAGVKDSSPIIPGHGGVLDRFDSFILSSPVCYIFVKYFLFN
ncbi:MAG: phosphatidate cytidylyltransferase [Candidatus Helarchaeota archaeon]|nr:phosphatidate cytidylyltransferase [Candidatus Helarchaeota archaeon]